MRWWWVCDVYWLGGKEGVKVGGGGLVAIQGEGFMVVLSF